MKAFATCLMYSKILLTCGEVLEKILEPVKTK